METMFSPRKKIFMGLPKHVAAYHLAQSLEEGTQVNIPFRFDRATDWLRGRVITFFRDNQGILLLIRNAGYRNDPPYGDSAVPGWDVVPLWLSRNGQSGILTTWKEGDLSIRDIVSFFSYQEKQRDK